MRLVYEAKDRVEAQLVCGFLESHRVSATVLGDYLSGAAGELPVNIYPAVWILEDEDWPRARDLLHTYQQLAQQASGKPWRCTACGEQMEGAFELCWNCGTEKVKK